MHIYIYIHMYTYIYTYIYSGFPEARQHPRQIWAQTTVRRLRAPVGRVSKCSPRTMSLGRPRCGSPVRLPSWTWRRARVGMSLWPCGVRTKMQHLWGAWTSTFS